MKNNKKEICRLCKSEMKKYEFKDLTLWKCTKCSYTKNYEDADVEM